MAGNKVKVLTFKHGGRAALKNLPVEEILIKDESERESYIIGEEAVPYRYNNWLGFPKHGRIFMVLERIADTIPLQIVDLQDTRRISRKTDTDVYLLEDMALYKEVQKAQAGDTEPEWAKHTGITIKLLGLACLAVGAIWFFQSGII